MMRTILCGTICMFLQRLDPDGKSTSLCDSREVQTKQAPEYRRGLSVSMPVSELR